MRIKVRTSGPSAADLEILLSISSCGTKMLMDRPINLSLGPTTCTITAGNLLPRRIQDCLPQSSSREIHGKAETFRLTKGLILPLLLILQQSFAILTQRIKAFRQLDWIRDHLQKT